MRFVQQHPFAGAHVIGHVRRATRGEVALRNCQPFVRELGGVWHSFAHNGDLPGIEADRRFRPDAFRPVGESDSERAFCALLARLRRLWLADAQPPERAARVRIVEAFAAELRSLGPANFVCCDGDLLIAHAGQPDGGIAPPGLWRLARRCPEGGSVDADGLRIAALGGEQEVVLFVSVPLTAEVWVPLACGEVAMARAGRMWTASRDAAAPSVSFNG